MTEQITVTHCEIPITYDEEDDRWKFTLRGRDRSAETLAKAREYIDKPLPAGKAKPFEPITGWLIGYDKTPERITVTGIAERKYGREAVWIKDAKGERSKETIAYSVYPSTPENDAIAEQVLAKKQQISTLMKESQDLRDKLTALVLPQEEEQP